MSSVVPGAVLQAFDKTVARAHLCPDRAQLIAVSKLDALATRISQSQHSGNIRTRMCSWFTTAPEMQPPKGIYLYGGVGRGKTMLMDLFFDVMPGQHKSRMHYHAFMTQAHDQLHVLRRRHREPVPVLVAQLIKRGTLLCLDEFNVTDITDAMLLSRLFSALFQAGLVLVTTSNLHPDQLYQHGLNRERFLPFLDKLKACCEVVHLDSNQDYRMLKLAGRKAFRVGTLEETNIALDEIWADLTQGADHVARTLDHHGRSLRFDRTVGGILDTDFATLCRQPLAAEDYRQIAVNFHTIFLRNLPQMSQADRNEARRFINFVDVLYDHGTRLIAGASVPPKQLYAAKFGQEMADFARTVSRLHEMQSTAYLQSHPR